MKNKILIFILLPFFLQSYKYDLSICAIFQDEAEWLKEWVEFHRLVGVNHFWLYNNCSQDNYKTVLEPYIQQGIVELKDWPSPLDEDWTPHQIAAYNDCLFHAKGKTKWLAFIDIDEFIVPVKHKKVTDILKPLEKKKNVGGLMIHWQFFGPGAVWEIPHGKTMVETLLLKASQKYSGNAQVKSIIRPETVQHFLVHGGNFIPPYRDITMNGHGGPFQPIQVDKIRIHHYWTRTQKYWYQSKLPRRERLENRVYSTEEIEKIFLDLSCVYDDTILRFVPKLKIELSK